MKVSIITATLNNRDTIEDCLNSIYNQSYKDIEHIIIDGGSSDGTLEFLSNYKNSSIIVSEPDDGIYYALNKGLILASGDIIGFLHADDIYADKTVIDKIVSNFERHNVESCYGDLIYVSKKNTEKTVRYWKSCTYKKGLFQKGWMPPHPAFFVKKSVYDQYGCFDTNFRIAADYEIMVRFLERNGVSTFYINKVLVKMRTGGTSNRSLRNILLKSKEDYRARKKNNVSNALSAVLLKNLSKIPQFLGR